MYARDISVAPASQIMDSTEESKKTELDTPVLPPHQTMEEEKQINSTFKSLREKLWDCSYSPSTHANDLAMWSAENSCHFCFCLMTPTVQASFCCDQYIMEPLIAHERAYAIADWTCGSLFTLGCCLPNAIVATPISMGLAFPICVCFVCTNFCCLEPCGSSPLIPPSTRLTREIINHIQEKNLNDIAHTLQSIKIKSSLSKYQKESILYLSLTHHDDSISLTTRMQIFDCIARNFLPWSHDASAYPHLERPYIRTLADAISTLIVSQAPHVKDMLKAILTQYHDFSPPSEDIHYYYDDHHRLSAEKNKLTRALLNAYQAKTFSLREVENMIKLIEPHCPLDHPEIVKIKNKAAGAPVILVGLFGPKESKSSLEIFRKDPLFEKHLIQSIFHYADLTDHVLKEKLEQKDCSFRN